MRTAVLFRGLLALAMIGAGVSLAQSAGEPTIPPELTAVSPHGLERGLTKTFVLEGRNLANVHAVLFDAPGISAKVTDIVEVPEKITGPRINVDLAAQVPLGKKQTARMEVTVTKDAKPGLHWFRIQTPLGTSNVEPMEISALPELDPSADQEQMSGKDGQNTTAFPVSLPATLVGTLAWPGATHRYTFEGTAGKEMVFQVVASAIGSKLRSELALLDSSGRTLARSGEYSREPDAVLTYKLPGSGSYTLVLSDREEGGGADRYYRLRAGALPYVSSVFPLGVRAGDPAEVDVRGANLGDIHEVKVNSPKSAQSWMDLPLGGPTTVGKTVKLVVGDEPEVMEREPNDSPVQAQPVSLPVTINGHIASASGRQSSEQTGQEEGSADEDYFRFRAHRGERLTLEVAAARLGSPLDSVIEVLDSKGQPIQQATLRCLFQTTTTLSDRDSRSTGIRLVSTTGLHENDYLMVGDELVRVGFISDQPDSDIFLKGVGTLPGGLRRTYLGTSPSVRAINTNVYKVQILPPGTEFPPNGLPVFHLTYRNDDGGPGYEGDSRLEFTAPADGEYIAHLKDIRGLEGPDFAYRLTIRDVDPDFSLAASPENPNIPKGGDVPITIEANRTAGYEGPIEIGVEGLPKGVTDNHASIPADQDSTVVVLSAPTDAASGAAAAPIRIVGRAIINGKERVRVANRMDGEDAPLQVATVIPPPDVVVTAEPNVVALEAGNETKVTLHVDRKNGFDGRVPCYVMNLPPGVRVVNIGLNGVLVDPAQSTRTFTLKAENTVKTIDQPIYVVAEVESNSSTRHASAPVMLKVRDASVASAEAAPKPAVSSGDRH